jgi:hypothetical protein
VTLELGDLDEVERYAEALEDFTKSEPLLWADFFIARGRALAARARGQADPALVCELQRLRDEGLHSGAAGDRGVAYRLRHDAPGNQEFGNSLSVPALAKGNTRDSRGNAHFCISIKPAKIDPPECANLLDGVTGRPGKQAARSLRRYMMARSLTA